MKSMMFFRIFVLCITLFLADSTRAQVTFPLQSVSHEHQTCVRYDENGNLYVAGKFNGQIDFDPGPADYYLNAGRGESAFLASYNPAGIFRWVRLIEMESIAFPIYNIEDNADLSVYNSGWQNTNAVAGFGNWFNIPGSGRRELNSATPLEGTRSWQIMATNYFFGVGRIINPSLTNGIISVLIRHGYTPNGGFNGFNLSRPSASSSVFGDYFTEIISCSMNTSNQITVTVDFGYKPDLTLEPTTDGNLQGDLLEYTIDVRGSGPWTLAIKNLSEPETPIVSTNFALYFSSSIVRSIRFGSFIGNTNQFLGFDRIRIATGAVESIVEPLGLTIETGVGAWVYGGFAGIMQASDAATNFTFSSPYNTNGFAILYNKDGSLVYKLHTTSTSPSGHSTVSGVIRDSTPYRNVFGTTVGPISITPTNKLTPLPDYNFPIMWQARFVPTGGVRSANMRLNHGINSVYGATPQPSAGHSIIISFYDSFRGLSSAGGDDIAVLMAYEASLDGFSFGGLGQEIPCPGGVIWDNDEHLYFGGQFQQTIAFDTYDPDTLQYISTNITSIGTSDIFITAFGAANQMFTWSRSIGGAESNVMQSLALSHNTNIVIAGAFRGTMEMDGTEGSYTLTSTSTNGGMDGFVASYDRNGKFLWAHQVGSDTSNTNVVAITSLAVDSANRLTLGGHFENNVRLDLSNSVLSITNAGSHDIMIIQLEEDGSLAGPKITNLQDNNGDHSLSVATRAGVNVQIESSDLTGSWNYVTNITQTTGNVHVITGDTSDSNLIYRAVTDW